MTAFVLGSETSKEATERIGAETLRNKARIAFYDTADDGATSDEVQMMLGLNHQTGAARVFELYEQGWIYKKGARRATRSGANAEVYVHYDFALYLDIPEASVYSPPPWSGEEIQARLALRSIKSAYNNLKIYQQKCKRRLEPMGYGEQLQLSEINTYLRALLNLTKEP